MALPAENKRRVWNIVIIALLMILFGIAEVITGFTQNFIGILSTSQGTIPAYASAAVGSFYAIGGLLLLIRKKPAMTIAFVCLVIVILGRIALVMTGIYPVNTFLQIFSIAAGTAIAFLFALYVWQERTFFPEA
jgi:hypothetical protein